MQLWQNRMLGEVLPDFDQEPKTFRYGNTADILTPRFLLATTEYLDHFARFKRKENVEAVERLLSAHKELVKFERAQLGTFPFTSPCLPIFTCKQHNGTRSKEKNSLS